MLTGHLLSIRVNELLTKLHIDKDYTTHIASISGLLLITLCLPYKQTFQISCLDSKQGSLQFIYRIVAHCLQ